MNKFLIILLSGLIQLSVFSQPHYKTIKVSRDIELIKISNNAYVHVSYWDVPRYGRISSNGLIFIEGNDAFLFDTPMTDSLTIELVSWMKDSMKLNIVGFVPNHWHADCMGGLRTLQNQKIESYANQMTIDIAKSKNLPIPALWFSRFFDNYGLAVNRLNVFFLVQLIRVTILLSGFHQKRYFLQDAWLKSFMQPV